MALLTKEYIDYYLADKSTVIYSIDGFNYNEIIRSIDNLNLKNVGIILYMAELYVSEMLLEAKNTDLDMNNCHFVIYKLSLKYISETTTEMLEILHNQYVFNSYFPPMNFTNNIKHKNQINYYFGNSQSHFTNNYNEL